MSHRSMMYDPQTSTRGFKRYCNTRGGTEGKRRGYALEQAYLLGQFAAGKAFARNPYPPGKRHYNWAYGFAEGRGWPDH